MNRLRINLLTACAESHFVRPPNSLDLSLFRVLHARQGN